ncbi:hypothetical protein GWO43_16190 [candidate division KSB1 bacterium]|nr:hypothetical protein [candidate division KSB1 bacterium]NIV68774.1 hypothetical protein [Phycisphaerae bacterium]NIS25491.1 hypothetical protein [candidate division KSB1 bacterium]NIT72384.1 hypothetical protein [candidate division KSB1 bacterium]NIU26168.1 hypothetical protein [candidate division KSB1 bacterium]
MKTEYSFNIEKETSGNGYWLSARFSKREDERERESRYKKERLYGRVFDEDPNDQIEECIFCKTPKDLNKKIATFIKNNQ